MSATTATTNHRRAKVDPVGLRIWFWGISSLVVGVLLVQGAHLKSSGVELDLGYFLLWAVAMAVADYLEVQFWRGVHLTMSLTVGIAAAMVFDPVIAASVAFVGSLDPREVRGEVPLRRALYNRSQVAAAVGLARSSSISSKCRPLTGHSYWRLLLSPSLSMVWSILQR
jgi:hypothetical protein